MYKYNCDRDGIYIVVDGNEYRLEYDSFSVGTTSSKCSKCDFFNGKCRASESCIRIENQFPDSYWKCTAPVYVETDNPFINRAKAYVNEYNTVGCLKYNDSNDNNVVITVDFENNF